MHPLINIKIQKAVNKKLKIGFKRKLSNISILVFSMNVDVNVIRKVIIRSCKKNLNFGDLIKSISEKNSQNEH